MGGSWSSPVAGWEPDNFGQTISSRQQHFFWQLGIGCPPRWFKKPMVTVTVDQVGPDQARVKARVGVWVRVGVSLSV